MKIVYKFSLYGFLAGLVYTFFALGLHLFCFYVLNTQSCGLLRILLIIIWEKIVFFLHLSRYFFGSGNLTFLYEILASVLVFTVTGLIIGLMVKVVKFIQKG